MSDQEGIDLHQYAQEHSSPIDYQVIQCVTYDWNASISVEEI